jgi:hypothetical protein
LDVDNQEFTVFYIINKHIEQKEGKRGVQQHPISKKEQDVLFQPVYDVERLGYHFFDRNVLSHIECFLGSEFFTQKEFYGT